MGIFEAPPHSYTTQTAMAMGNVPFKSSWAGDL